MPSSGNTLALFQAKGAGEILRKFELATKVHNADDREIILGEIFNDVCGSLDPAAKEHLGTRDFQTFYELLAPYFAQEIGKAHKLLTLCKRLWSSDIVPPVYVLLLHSYLLQLPTGHDSLSQLMNVLVHGSQECFWLDVSSGTDRFQRYHLALQREVAAKVESYNPDRDTKSPLQVYSKLTRLITGWVPYYAPPGKVLECLQQLPQVSVNADTTAYPADYMLIEFSTRLISIPSRKALLIYLNGLEPVAASLAKSKLASMTAKARLQNQLYFLTMPGGPRYYPVEVRTKALRLVHLVAPTGGFVRTCIRAYARLCSPKDWSILLMAWAGALLAATRDTLLSPIHLCKSVFEWHRAKSRTE